jgi:hypothetical protein
MGMTFANCFLRRSKSVTRMALNLSSTWILCTTSLPLSLWTRSYIDARTQSLCFPEARPFRFLSLLLHQTHCVKALLQDCTVFNLKPLQKTRVHLVSQLNTLTEAYSSHLQSCACFGTNINNHQVTYFNFSLVLYTLAMSFFWRWPA